MRPVARFQSIKYITKTIYLIVFQCFISANAGSFEDFFKAIDEDKPQVIAQLLKRGFDPNTVDEKGQAALMLAYQRESFKVLDQLILWPDTQVEVRNPADESVLMLAALKGQLDLCRRLIERGADVNKTGWTALHYAATGGHVEVIRLLLDKHAYIDSTSPNGSTPLMMAARYGNSSAVKLLLEEGADPTIKNEKGLNAWDFANGVGRTEAASIIRAFLRARLPAGSW